MIWAGKQGKTHKGKALKKEFKKENVLGRCKTEGKGSFRFFVACKRGIGAGNKKYVEKKGRTFRRLREKHVEKREAFFVGRKRFFFAEAWGNYFFQKEETRFFGKGMLFLKKGDKRNGTEEQRIFGEKGRGKLLF